MWLPILFCVMAPHVGSVLCGAVTVSVEVLRVTFRIGSRFDVLFNGLPIEDLEAEVGISRVEGGTDRGTFDDFASVACEDAIREGVAHVLSKADKVTVALARVAREIRVVDAVVDRLEPGEAEDDADVDGGAMEHLEGDAMFEGRSSEVVENKADVFKGKEPTIFGGSSAVQEGVDIAFDVLPAAFSGVLVLHVGLADPGAD